MRYEETDRAIGGQGGSHRQESQGESRAGVADGNRRRKSQAGIASGNRRRESQAGIAAKRQSILGYEAGHVALDGQGLARRTRDASLMALTERSCDAIDLGGARAVEHPCTDLVELLLTQLSGAHVWRVVRLENRA